MYLFAIIAKVEWMGNVTYKMHNTPPLGGFLEFAINVETAL